MRQLVEDVMSWARRLSDAHAVAVIGYDDDRAAVRVKDSRGGEFADHGEWWLPYELIENPGFEDLWALTTINCYH